MVSINKLKEKHYVLAYLAVFLIVLFAVFFRDTIFTGFNVLEEEQVNVSLPNLNINSAVLEEESLIVDVRAINRTDLITGVGFILEDENGVQEEVELNASFNETETNTFRITPKNLSKILNIYVRPIYLFNGESLEGDFSESYAIEGEEKEDDIIVAPFSGSSGGGGGGGGSSGGGGGGDVVAGDSSVQEIQEFFFDDFIVNITENGNLNQSSVENVSWNGASSYNLSSGLFSSSEINTQGEYNELSFEILGDNLSLSVMLNDDDNWCSLSNALSNSSCSGHFTKFKYKMEGIGSADSLRFEWSNIDFQETQVCGNNIVEEGEQCDGGSDCSLACLFEPPPTDSTGWTNFTQSGDTRIIYVSSAGDDANDGLLEDNSVKTIGKAKSLVRDGFPDWILLNRGDVWNEAIGAWSLSGRSESEKMLISYYGNTSKSRPLLKTGSSIALSVDSNDEVSNFAVVGLQFISGSQDRTFGIKFLGYGENILLEDILVQGYKEGMIVQSTSGLQNFTLRRSEILDSYSGDKAQGLFLKNIHGILLEENLFDMSGWNPSKGDARDVLSHNVYVQVDSTNLTARGNIFSRGASHGLQARVGGTVEDNLFVQNSIGLSFGHVLGGSDPVSGGVTGRIERNVIVESTDLTNTSAGRRGQGMEIGNIKSALVTGNIISRDLGEGSENGGGISLTDVGIGVENTNITGNVVFGWKKSLNVNDDFGFQNVLFADNVLQSSDENQPLIKYGANLRNGKITYKNNTYYSTLLSNSWFKPQGSSIGFVQWVLASGDTGSLATEKSFADSTRTLGSYSSSIGGLGSVNGFLNEARKQEKYNWRTEYTAGAVNDYIREGFG